MEDSDIELDLQYCCKICKINQMMIMILSWTYSDLGQLDYIRQFDCAECGITLLRCLLASSFYSFLEPMHEQ